MTRLNTHVRDHWIQLDSLGHSHATWSYLKKIKKEKKNFTADQLKTFECHVGGRFNSVAFLQGLLAEVALPRRFNARPSPWTFHGSFEYYAFVDIPGERIGSILWSTACKKILGSPSVRVTDAHVSTECQTFRQPFTRRRRRSIKLRAMDRTHAVQSCKARYALRYFMRRPRNRTALCPTARAGPWDINASIWPLLFYISSHRAWLEVIIEIKFRELSRGI